MRPMSDGLGEPFADHADNELRLAAFAVRQMIQTLNSCLTVAGRTGASYVAGT